VGAAPITVRLPPDQLASLDKWVAGQDDPMLTRPEAIRRLIEAGLKATTDETQKGERRLPS
jgi:hypothetical protein